MYTPRYTCVEAIGAAVGAAVGAIVGAIVGAGGVVVQ